MRLERANSNSSRQGWLKKGPRPPLKWKRTHNGFYVSVESRVPALCFSTMRHKASKVTLTFISVCSRQQLCSDLPWQKKKNENLPGNVLVRGLNCARVHGYLLHSPCKSPVGEAQSRVLCEHDGLGQAVLLLSVELQGCWHSAIFPLHFRPA